MKQKFTIALLAIAALIFTFTACKKDASSSSLTSSDSTQAQSDDEVLANNSTDDATNDVITSLEGSGGSFASRPDSGGSAGNVSSTPPAITPPSDGHVSVDTSSIHKTITVSYTGTTASTSNCTRTGQVTLSFDTSLHWKTPGAVVTVNYDSLKITRTSDGKTITMNGSETITNLSGGLLKNLLPIDSIKHIVTGSLYVQYSNGTLSTLNESKQRVYTYNNGIIITTTGAGNGGIAEAGTDRYGHNYSTVITQPRVIKQSCDFRLVSGETVYTGSNGAITTTFGLDANGNPVTSCPIGVFYYKLTYTLNGVAHSYTGQY